VGASRRFQVRQWLLKFLIDGGAGLDRDKIPCPTKKDIERDRQPIHWLSLEQARLVASFLESFWQDAFKFQVFSGLRPCELITLRRMNFEPDFSYFKLSKFGEYTLKNGPRDLVVDDARIVELLQRRFAQHDVLFPGKWTCAEGFADTYRKKLKAAGEKAGVPWKVDCVTGRRTAASLWARAGISMAEIAARLGDDIETVTTHYAKIGSGEVRTKGSSVI
jgi:integrase